MRAYFEHEFVFIVTLDTEVADTARSFLSQKLPKSLPWLRPADAAYIATAAVANITEVHAFDGPLSKLTGRFKTANGSLIEIREPRLSAASAPLLQAVGE